MTAAAKYKPPVDTTPFYDVYLEDLEKVVRAIADSRVPVGAIKVDLAFLRQWARDQMKPGETPQAIFWMKENGLRVERRAKP